MGIETLRYRLRLGSAEKVTVKEGKLSDRSREVLSKHQDEELPVFPEVRLGIVTPSYRELLWGGIPKMLENLSKIDQPAGKVGVLFVVNNPRIYAMLGKCQADIADGDWPSLVGRVKQEYQANGWEIGRQEKYWLDKVRKGDEEMLGRAVTGFAENQAAIALLREVSKINRGVSSETLEQVWERVKLQWPELPLTGDVPFGFRAAVRKRLPVAVADCSTLDKGFDEADIGRAKNEGLHLGFTEVFPEADMIHLADGDSFHPSGLIRNILNLIEEQHPDVITLPQYFTGQSVPEGIEDRTLDQRLQVILGSFMLAFGVKFRQYANNFESSLGGSQLVVSRKVYYRHEYPFGPMNSDFWYAEAVMGDSKLKVVFGHDTGWLLGLINRGRKESIDGSGFVLFGGQHETLELKRQEMDEYGVKWAELYLNEIVKLEGVFGNRSKELRRMVEESLQFVCAERRVFIRRAELLFGYLEEFGLPRGERLDTLLAVLPARIRDFAGANRVLVETVVERFEAEGLHTQEEMRQWVRHYLPEYFLPPDKERLEKMDYDGMLLFIEQEHRLPEGLTLRDFMHLGLAVKLFSAKKKNPRWRRKNK